MQVFGVSVWLPTLFVRHGFLLAKSFGYTMIIFAAVPVSQVIAIWFQNKVSRKWALFIMTWGGTVFFVLFGMSFQYRWPVPAMVGSQVLQVLLYNGVIVVLYTMTAELFPTRVRTLGMGIVNGVGRLGAMLGPFILGVLLKSSTSIAHILYLFALPPIIGSACVVIAIKVDSRRKSLEDISMEMTGARQK
jgi:putative MFS transporter